MKVSLFIRGLCMGIADIIPGVSGGTMALVLGIYTQFIAAVKSLNLRPVGALLRWVFSGFATAEKEALVRARDSVHWRFLLPLGAGIAAAMGLGSIFIPRLMDQYPSEMRGLFFGLILASVGVPLKMMPRRSRRDLLVGFGTALLFLALGYLVTDPNRKIDTTSDWKSLRADEAVPLKELCRRGPSAASSADVYWADENGALRVAHLAANPQEAARLGALQAAERAPIAADKRAQKARAHHYDEIVVPAGTTVSVPRPARGFILLAGAIAICAMILPGISGSFILLILGCYYFVLNAVKGSLAALVRFSSPGDGPVYVLLFACGCLLGLALFSRVLNWLLRRLPTPTMGALAGLMVGCLRGVWPWRETGPDGLQNVLPAEAAGLWPAAAIALLGMAIALGIEFLGSNRAASDD